MNVAASPEVQGHPGLANHDEELLGAETFVRPSDRLIAHPAQAVGLITTAALAQVLGKGNARAARDWCQRHRIPYRRDGKFNWVALDDVRRTLEGLPLHATEDDRARAAAAAVATLTRKR